MTRSLSVMIATLVVVAIGMLITSCQDPSRQVSEGSLRNATANGAAAELQRLGYRLKERLNCQIPRNSTMAVARVGCAGETVRGLPVRVDAVAYDADTRHPQQDFVITVAGHEVLRKPCLGEGCREDL
jgi:hypothetical protein